MKKNFIKAAFVAAFASIAGIHHSRKLKCQIWQWLMWKRWLMMKILT